MKNKIKGYISNSLEILEEAQLNLNNSEGKKTIVLDKKYFDNMFMNDASISECITEIRALKDVKKPVLYWFELASSDVNESIREKFIEGYREPVKKGLKTPYRNTS
ncbi:hypothetical protein BST83_01015 [Polaribacter filamentus]|uniref:Uncharacterized protein n=1 Tax=Polaribacter filamentus TaxID=53483 RepID=A0A2S7L2M0_9FLAO|nr:hypothetical protein [Polaribacter filamentus]PQB08963.1 hypothetical protein BST83_01015 [Polaribacter filamentus]